MAGTERGEYVASYGDEFIANAMRNSWHGSQELACVISGGWGLRLWTPVA